jgi:DnaJ-class molecular chaperone
VTGVRKESLHVLGNFFIAEQRIHLLCLETRQFRPALCTSLKHIAVFYKDMGEDLYKTLGLERNASLADIKDAYKRAARQHHPDKGGDAETFKKVQRAYEVLSDESRRSIYNMTGSLDGEAEVPLGGMGFGFPMDINQMFNMFGSGSGGPKRRQRGEKAPPKVDRVALSLAQFYKGHTFELKFERQRHCADCKGCGFASYNVCKDCKGSGSKSQTIMMGPMMMMQTNGPCGACGGEGKTGGNSCLSCSGQGKTGEEKVLTAIVKPGMGPGEVLKFEEACSDNAEYARPGDVHIILEETEDEHGWTRKGVHLEYLILVTLGESLVGKKVVLEGHPKGEAVTVEIPSGTINMERLMFSGLGMPKGPEGEYGNLYVTVQVQPQKGEREKLRTEARAFLASLFGIAI